MDYRGYLISGDKISPMLSKVAVSGQGGKIPAVLESLFTSVGVAKIAIDDYLTSKEQKNGKARSESGD